MNLLEERNCKSRTRPKRSLPTCPHCWSNKVKNFVTTWTHHAVKESKNTNNIPQLSFHPKRRNGSRKWIRKKDLFKQHSFFSSSHKSSFSFSSIDKSKTKARTKEWKEEPNYSRGMHRQRGNIKLINGFNYRPITFALSTASIWCTSNIRSKNGRIEEPNHIRDP